MKVVKFGRRTVVAGALTVVVLGGGAAAVSVASPVPNPDPCDSTYSQVDNTVWMINRLRNYMDCRLDRIEKAIPSQAPTVTATVPGPTATVTGPTTTVTETATVSGPTVTTTAVGPTFTIDGPRPDGSYLVNYDLGDNVNRGKLGFDTNGSMIITADGGDGCSAPNPDVSCSLVNRIGSVKFTYARNGTTPGQDIAVSVSGERWSNGVIHVAP